MIRYSCEHVPYNLQYNWTAGLLFAYMNMLQSNFFSKSNYWIQTDQFVEPSGQSYTYSL